MSGRVQAEPRRPVPRQHTGSLRAQTADSSCQRPSPSAPRHPHATKHKQRAVVSVLLCRRTCSRERPSMPLRSASWLTLACRHCREGQATSRPDSPDSCSRETSSLAREARLRGVAPGTDRSSSARVSGTPVPKPAAAWGWGWGWWEGGGAACADDDGCGGPDGVHGMPAGAPVLPLRRCSPAEKVLHSSERPCACGQGGGCDVRCNKKEEGGTVAVRWVWAGCVVP